MTLEDNVIAGGAGECIAAGLSEEHADVLKLGWPDRFIEHGSSDDLYRAYGLDSGSVAERIKEKLEGKA